MFNYRFAQLKVVYGSEVNGLGRMEHNDYTSIAYAKRDNDVAFNLTSNFFFHTETQYTEFQPQTKHTTALVRHETMQIQINLMAISCRKFDPYTKTIVIDKAGDVFVYFLH